MHTELKQLLQQRLSIIADHSFRDQNPAAHLQSLKEVSEKISDYTNRHIGDFDPKLRHYLLNFSYQKALDHLP